MLCKFPCETEDKERTAYTIGTYSTAARIIPLFPVTVLPLAMRQYGMYRVYKTLIPVRRNLVVTVDIEHGQHSWSYYHDLSCYICH